MINEDCWNDYLSALENDKINYQDFISTAFKFIEKIIYLIPDEIKGHLNVADNYWNIKKNNAVGLEKSKIHIWEYFDKNQNSLSNEKSSATRCLLFLFYEEPEQLDKTIETIDWFFIFLKDILDFCDELKEYLSQKILRN